jgi:hypothetical protein
MASCKRLLTAYLAFFLATFFLAAFLAGAFLATFLAAFFLATVVLRQDFLKGLGWFLRPSETQHPTHVY